MTLSYHFEIEALAKGTVGPISTTITLANGANSDIALPATERVHIIGPTSGYSISGFAGGVDGRKLRLFNSVAQPLTLTNNATSAAANRLLTLTGADVVLRSGTSFATLSYDGTSSLWILESING